LGSPFVYGEIDRKVAAMLGVKKYEKSYIDGARAATEARIHAFDELKDPGGFEPIYFNTMVLALDHLFMNRLRGVEGKDGTR
jgi:hypothetical protein